ncbi:nose resistant to fluoxetine protein 6-like [Dermacentor variabilis]|uniref:nose resistant to fluoxetine protein 6-like n=1 Tax=Dermacentor variabilis TaxID=34621 RepID=UPI003F5C8615
MPTPLRRKLLEADVRPECTAGLLRTMRGFQNLDPWALKLFDASGKYPTGLFEGSRVDMGAFDECLSIVLRDGYGNMLSRGQYCNLMIYVTNGSAVEEVVRSFSDVLHPRLQYFRKYFSYTKLPVGRLAVCSLNDCNQQDLQALVAIGALSEFITAFSATSNTRMLLKVSDKNKQDHYALQFLHGMRFYGIVHIALGHCGSVMTCIPLFFIIMCLYALQTFVKGPNTKAFFQDLHKELASHWWHLLLQIRNFDTISERDVIPHVWYLSTDFQLFVVSLVTLLIFKRVMLRTLNEYYIRPYYHTVCYFGGCMTYLVVDDFKERKISKWFQQVCWYGSVACCLFCVFVKFAWYRSPNPVSAGVALLAAFLDRILWTLFLAWITLACSTGRGGALSKLLSWNAYVPLSKLSFGVYLIHVPFLHLLFRASRERMFWSIFNQLTLLFLLLVWSFLLSYLSFLICEAPTAALDKLLFSRLIGGGERRGDGNSEKAQPENNHAGSDVKKPETAEDSVFSRC